MKWRRLVGLCFLFAALHVIPAVAAPANGTKIAARAIGQEKGVTVYSVTYASDGLDVKGRLFMPKSSTPLPVVIFNHDGVDGISHATSVRAVQLASAGFAVFAPSYRGEDGSQGTIEIARGEVDDVLNAARLMDGWPGVDAKRMAVVGMSHGALISVLAAERSSAFRCVVEAYGVMDIFAWWTYLKSHGYRTDDAISLRVYGKGPQDRPAAFHLRNAVEHLGTLNVPLLVLQGTADKTVPSQQAKRIEAACRKLGKPCEVNLYEGAQHGFLIYGGSEPNDPPAEVRGQKSAWGVMLGFLKKWL